MSDSEKITREEMAAALEARAKKLREGLISDEEVEKMSSGCDACCNTCQCATSDCWLPYDGKCHWWCVKSSPN